MRHFVTYLTCGYWTQLTKTNMAAVTVDKSIDVTSITVSDDGQNAISDKSAIDDEYRRDLMNLFRELRSHAIALGEYYKDHHSAERRDGAECPRRRMHNAACRLHEHLDHGIQPGVDYLVGVVHVYDVDETIRANGYRSFIFVVERCCQRLLGLVRYSHLSHNSSYW